MINKGMIMRKLVCPRFPQFQACVSPLGQLHSRPLFGGYSLAIDDTVFAMVAEGDIYRKLYMVWSKSNKPGKAARLFIQFVRELYAYLWIKSISVIRLSIRQRSLSLLH